MPTEEEAWAALAFTRRAADPHPRNRIARAIGREERVI